MGAWGHGYFEDDAALDFMADVEASDEPKELLQEAINNALEAEYLESDEGAAVIIAGTYIDRQVNGTRFTNSNNDEPLDVDTFPDRHPEVDLSDLRPGAVTALQKVLEEDSELHELWEENEELYPAWRSGVEQLIQRLTT
jgi:hypothetical protein